ncbi:hypothetical protein HPB50_023411 [Hyalomma asiaticum]|uniref:Uncharacterized protein n=1 Tax=Hyalomma asiaticum TaxID=266040 RepID=A0ACB7S2I7_HYAAI|nr:hypothetical protein HPB50_023411 [Hyalomma asiaticum]
MFKNRKLGDNASNSRSEIARATDPWKHAHRFALVSPRGCALNPSDVRSIHTYAHTSDPGSALLEGVCARHTRFYRTWKLDTAEVLVFHVSVTSYGVCLQLAVRVEFSARRYACGLSDDEIPHVRV